MACWRVAAPVALAASLGSLALSGSALASGVVEELSGDLTWRETGAAVDDRVTIKYAGSAIDPTTTVTFESPSAIAVDASADECSAGGTTTVSCVMQRITLDRVTGRGAGGNDQLVLDSNLAYSGPPVPVTFEGGPGTDILDGGDAGDLLLGGAGGDTVRGGPGADQIFGGDGDAASAGADGGDALSGEAGGDHIVAEGGPDDIEAGSDADVILGGDGDDAVTAGKEADTVVDGQSGTGDRIRYDEPDRTGGVVVDLSSPAADGGVAEGTEVAAGFEHVTGTRAPDQITGTSDANRLDGRGGDDVLRGQRGDDELSGGAGSDTVTYSERAALEPVAVNLESGEGGGAEEADSLGDIENVTGGDGGDTLRGDGHANSLRGNGGADTLTGGAGVDALRAGAGRDHVNALDGEFDTADCGDGEDTASADSGDSVRNCETRTGPGGGPPGGGGPGGGDPGGGTPPPEPATFGSRTRVVLRLAERRIPRRGPVLVSVRNDNGFRIRGTLRGETAGPVPVGSRRVRVALRPRAFGVAAERARIVRLRLPVALRRVLVVRRRLALRLTALVADPAGTTRAVTRRVVPRLRG